MIYMLFWSLIFVFSTLSLQFSCIYGGVDRTFKGLDKSCAEASLTTFATSSSGGPMFDKEVFSLYAENYFSFNLRAYLAEDDYRLAFYFYDVSSGEESDSELSYCDGIRVNFSANVMGMVKYVNTVAYQVKEGNNHGS